MKEQKLFNYYRHGLAFLLFILISMVHCYAQDEDTALDTDTTTTTLLPKGSQIVKLKKNYVLGNGFTLQSSGGSLTISPTLQTLFAVNTLKDNISDLRSSFSIERARITLAGNLFDNKFRLIARLNLPANYQSTTTGNRSFNTTLQEAYIEYRLNANQTFNLGLRADYIDSRELRMQGENLSFITRSLVSEAFDAIFDYGLRYRGNFKLGGKHLLRPYASITTGDSRAALQKNFGGYRYGIRLDYLPFDRFSEGGEFYMEDLARERKPKLVLGVVYSYNDGATSAIGTNGGRWLYADSTRKSLLPDHKKFIADYLFKYAGFYSMGSYVITHAHVPSGIAGEYRLTGVFVPYTASQTIEQRKNIVRGRLNLGHGYNIQAGYVFPSDWAVGLRYSSLSADAVSNPLADYDKSYALSITRYILNHNLKIQAQLGYDAFREVLKTPGSKGNYSAQFMATIQL